MNLRARGAAGEQRAEAYLQAKGYSVLARNFRTRRGEVDIVARNDERVVFVEVKSWDVLGVDSLEYSIGPRKRQRILAASRWFLRANPDLMDRRVGFDVILVRGSGITHLEDAFTGV